METRVVVYKTFNFDRVFSYFVTNAIGSMNILKGYFILGFVEKIINAI